MWPRSTETGFASIATVLVVVRAMKLAVATASCGRAVGNTFAADAASPGCMAAKILTGADARCTGVLLARRITGVARCGAGTSDALAMAACCGRPTSNIFMSAQPVTCLVQVVSLSQLT